MPKARMYMPCAPTDKVRTIMMKEIVPRIFIRKDTLETIRVTVGSVKEEISWLNRVTRRGYDFFVYDFFLLKQTCTPTHTEFDDDAYGPFIQEMMKKYPGKQFREFSQSLKSWGHSHVKMGVTPSSTDDDQMNQRFCAHQEPEYGIRLIFNQKGSINGDIFLYPQNLKFLGVDVGLYTGDIPE